MCVTDPSGPHDGDACVGQPAGGGQSRHCGDSACLAIAMSVIYVEIHSDMGWVAHVDLDAVVLASAGTVHTSQEPEYPVAVIGPPRCHPQ